MLVLDNEQERETMNNAAKVVAWIAFFTVASVAFLVFAEQATPESLVESSVAELGDGTQTRGVDHLYKEMGFNYPTAINPCIDLEKDTRRYCTPNALKFLLDKPDRVFSPAEDKLFRSFLSGPDTCGQVALYIERICRQENFWRILKYFSQKREVDE